MTLVRYNPRHHSNAIDRCFSGEMRDMPHGRSFSHDLFESVWGPRADIAESENAYKISMDLPGMNREDVDITIEDNVLTIEGERVSKFDEKDTMHRNERNYGKFARKFNLKNSFDNSKIDASFDNGVLTIELPKSKETLARKIEINKK
ncbi:MAG: Hsp20/alpha crystallin family protein [Candidatus Electryonea clarkiae]|nr:Hsp20/alpha crystallin family protein [Candidatus Electryonea clarkiae]